MTSALGALVPFSLALPSSYGLSPAATATTGTATTAPKDVLDVRVPLPGGTLDVEAGDRLALSDLFSAGKTAWDTVSRYRVALRDDPATTAPGGARLLLRGEDVTARTDFTPLEFNELQVAAGPSGARSDLVVVARGNGALPADSPALSVTLASTGTRSLAAAPALRNEAGADEAAFLSVVRDAAIHTGFGAARPAVTAVGNLTAEAGDVLALRDLFDAGKTAWRDVALYRVALRDDPGSPGGGRLLLGDADVTDRTDFTPEEFDRLRFVAGADGARTEIVAVARRGTPPAVTDSVPVAITAETTGTRSLNAVAALRTEPGPDEARFLAVARDATIHTGFGAPRPAVTSAGDVTVAGGDALSLRDLFDAGRTAWDTVALYRVAFRDDPATPGGARLLLGDADVTDRTDFTPMEFANLRFVAGPNGARSDLLVVARAGKPDAAGGLSSLVDSPAVAISVGATGARSLNAIPALRGDPGPGDAAFLAVARESTVFTGLGGARPTLATVGNVTAEAGDALALSDLFDAGPKAWDSVALYRVALREEPGTPGGARLLLDDAEVTDRTDFTPAEFARLRLVAGADGARTEMVVVARAGRPVGDEDGGAGGLTNIVDSPAVAITAAATGTRSLNAAAALRTEPGPDEAAFLKVAREATILTGLGATRPALRTAGNVTTEGGDALALRDLFDAGASAWDTVALYRVALRDAPGTPGGARLLLGEEDVTARTDFTPTEFNALRLVAGPDGARTEIVAVARAGRRDNGEEGGAGGLTGIVDSPAVAITATTTGTRSVNAAAALRTEPGADEAAFLGVLRDASVFTGIGGTRPSLSTAVGPSGPATPPGLLAARPGAFRVLGPATPTAAREVASLYAGAIGATRAAMTPTDARNAAALALLLGDGVGGVSTATDPRAGTVLALRASWRTVA